MGPIRINNGNETQPMSQEEQEQLAVSLAAAHVEPTSVDIVSIPVSEEPTSTEEVIEYSPVPVVQAPVVEPTPPVVETTDIKEEIPEYKRKNQNVTITDAYTHETNWDKEADTITLPSNFDEETAAILSRVPNINLLDNAKTRDWVQAVSEGTNNSSYNGTFIPTMEEESADFFQSVDHNGSRLAGARPKFKHLENETLSGERAAIRLMSHLGLGTLFQVPLWHSGIWITFKAPTESEIIELNRRQISDKIEMGRHSYGLAFSNTSSYTTDRLVDFALNHVYDMTLNINEVPTSDLKSLIDCQDIPSLLWGFICTMYPKGFQYRRGCVNDPEKCNFVIEEMLNIAKLQWTNRAALTEWQKAHMSTRRSNSKDKASIVRYKEEMLKTQKRRILFNEGEASEIAITLKTPNIAEYVDAGHRWISGLIELVDSTLGQDIRDQERNNYVMRHAQASSMRQYVHWVESIEMDTNIISDIESIEGSFNMLSSHDGIRNKFIEEVVKYINESTVTVIGIPTFDCPKCGVAQEETGVNLPNHKNIIPLDVIQLFFDLLTQRLSKINER